MSIRKGFKKLGRGIAAVGTLGASEGIRRAVRKGGGRTSQTVATASQVAVQTANDTVARVQRAPGVERLMATGVAKTLGKVAETSREVAEVIADIPASAEAAAQRAMEVASDKFKSGPAGAAFEMFTEHLERAVRDDNLTKREVVELFNKVGEAIVASWDVSVSESASIFERLEEAKQLALGAMGLGSEVGRIAGRLADVGESLERQGLIDTGDPVKNLKNGKVFLNGAGIDLRGFFLSLVAFRAGKLVPIQKADAKTLDVLYSDVPEANFQFYLQRLAAGTLRTADMTHIELTEVASGITKLYAIDTVFPSAPVGSAFPAIPATYVNPHNNTPTSATGAPVYRITAVRMTHDTQGLLQVLATMGIQSFNSAIAQALPLASNSIASLLNFTTGIDFSTAKAS